ncbi:MAG TPA: hypothetical protein VH643_39060 [Gemmataceae bacterium]|jgi:nicotinamide mononucleotide (NMN) deamidase PncC
MDATQRFLITRLHDSGHRCVLVVTGGGAGAASLLLSVPGGSRSVLEVVVPYSEQSLNEFLGDVPASFCSAETARSMAQRALDRARWLAPADAVAGIACTASLCSDRPKRGDHRFHLALQTPRRTTTHSLTLHKGARDREAEESLLDCVLLNAMAESFGLSERVEAPLLPGEELLTRTDPSADLLTALVEGRLSAVCVERDGRWRSDGPRHALLLPGSFNPVHHGHCALADVAEHLSGKEVAFELSIVNADKPPLAEEEARRRVVQFAGQAPLWLTRAPTFVEKAELFPGVVFVVGADTAERILQPRFYGDSDVQLAQAMERLRAHGCRFLVAGRVNSYGVFFGLEDLNILAAYRDLFTSISAGIFRLDVSSTRLREINQR